MNIRFMTFNIQHGLDYVKKVIDLNLMASTIKECQGEIIGLNEVYGGQEKEIAAILGYESYYFGKTFDYKSTGFGNAVISKHPIANIEVISIPDPEVKDEKVYYETRNILKVTFKNFRVTLFISHFGLAQSEQRNAVTTILKLTKDCINPYVFMGDLNMMPFDAKLVPIYEAMVDTAKFCNVTKNSFPSINSVRKIDYIFVSRDIKIHNADIVEIVAADHFPHIADLEIDYKEVLFNK